MLVAKKEIDEDFYEDWENKYKKASVSANRDKEINKVAELIE